MEIWKAIKIIRKDKPPTSSSAFRKWSEAQDTINQAIKDGYVLCKVTENRTIDATELFERVCNIQAENEQQYADIQMFLQMITNSETVI